MRISDWSSDVCSSDLRDIGKLTCKSYGLQAAHIAQIGRRGLKHAKTAVNLSHTAQDQTIIVRFSGDGAIAQACLFHCFVDEQPQMIALAETDKRIFDDIAGLNMRPLRQIMILGDEQSQWLMPDQIRLDRKSNRLNSSHSCASRMTSSD